MENKKSKGGWGLTYQEVYLMENLTIEAKAIYGFLCSFAGTGSEAYPSVDFMCRALSIGENRFYRHMNLLIGAGVVKKDVVRNGKLQRNIYTLTPNIHFEVLQNEGVENEGVENEGSNNNNINNNNINNNRDNIDYQLIADMYNETCVSFPKVQKLSEARKKAIKARLRTYSVEDFRKLFQMAESSTFLKGGNNRNWSASFDWLIADSNMAKVLDGNYQDKQARNTYNEPQTNTGGFELPDYLEQMKYRKPTPDDPFK